jgi:GAF domain-containing protein
MVAMTSGTDASAPPSLVALDSLQSVLRSLSEAESLEELYASAVLQAAGYFGVEQSALMLLDETGQLAVHPSAIGLSLEQQQLLSSQPVPQVCRQLAAHEKLAVIHLHDPSLAHLMDPTISLALHERDVLLGQVPVDGRLGGQVRIANRSDGLDFTQADAHLLALFSSQLGAQIRSLRLLDQERRARRLSEILRRVPQMVRQPSGGNGTRTDTDQQAILEGLLGLLRDAIGHSSGSVTLHEGRRMRIIAGSGHSLAHQLVGFSWEIAGDSKVSEILRTGKSVIIEDTANDPGWLQFRGWSEIRSWLGVPIWAPNSSQHRLEDLIGVLNIDSSRPNAFTAEDAAVAQSFGDQIAVVLANQKLYDSMAKRVAELAALREISLAVTAHRDLDRLLMILVEKAASLVQAEGGGIWQSDGLRRTLTMVAEHNLKPSLLGAKLNYGEGLSGRVVLTGVAEAVDDYRNWPDSTQLFADHFLGSAAAVPLLWQRKVLGVLTVFGGMSGRRFSEETLALLSLFADQAAIALANAQAYEEARAQAAFLNRLLEAANRLRLQMLPEDTASLVAQTVREVLGWRRVVIFLDDPSGERYMPAASAGVESLLAAQLQKQGWRKRDSAFRRPDFRFGNSYFVDSSIRPTPAVDAYPLPPRQSHDERAPFEWQDRDLLIVPMLAGGREIGFISVDDPQHGLKPSRSDIEALEIYAGQAAIALENARLFQETQGHLKEAEQRSRELALINQVTAAINSALGLDEVLSLILEQLRLLVSFDRGSIALLTGRELQIVGAVGFPPDGPVIGRRYAWDSFPLNREVIEQAHLVSIRDVLTDSRWVTIDPPSKVRAWLAVPLVRDGRPIGILTLTAMSPFDYSINDQQLVTAVAEQAALAIDKTRLLEETQRHLLRAEQRTQELTVLNRVSSHLGASLNLSDVLQSTVTQLASALGVEQAEIVLFNQARTHGHLVAEFQREPNMSGRGVTIAVANNPLMQLVTESHAPVAVRDVMADFLTQSMRQLMYDRGLKSLLLVPIMVRGEVIGTVGLDSLAAARDFSAAEIELAQTITNQAASAIANAQLHADVTHRAAQLQTIQGVTERITAILDPDELLKEVVDLLAARLGYYHVHIFLADETGEYMVSRAGSGEAGRRIVERGYRARVGPQGIVGWTAQSGRTVLVKDVTVDPHYTPDPDLPHTVAEIAAPIRTGSLLVGVLDVQADRHDIFEESDADLIETLADQIAIALENARLYGDVQERATQLGKAFEAQKALDKMKDEFVQTVSHELRTPLTFIKGYVELMLEGVLGDINADQSEALSIMAQRTENVVHLVNDIIALTRSEAMTAESMPIELGEIASAAVRSAQAVIGQEGLVLTLEVPPDLPLVMGDAQRLSQIYDNILGNAIKFSPLGGAITVRLVEEADMVRTEISDQGIGIPADAVERIWDRFYQVDGTTTRRYGGTGLGLAIVKRLVEAHSGRVGVKSVEGRGSTFFFGIPKADCSR